MAFLSFQFSAQLRKIKGCRVAVLSAICCSAEWPLEHDIGHRRREQRETERDK
uniref:Uncharacterized protein n=1 Tax=Rhizophora mucronata TaxID=61149 RepID=A0A2P2N5S9_RHIMU